MSISIDEGDADEEEEESTSEEAPTSVVHMGAPPPPPPPLPPTNVGPLQPPATLTSVTLSPIGGTHEHFFE